ncbi:MAG: hypothetical protein EBR01_08730 [Proteobacteria bacterium]|nr:hypothetical protein [Pseudomonadota bacterium]NBY18724.1 hypothetical protein [bacterium]
MGFVSLEFLFLEVIMNLVKWMQTAAVAMAFVFASNVVADQLDNEAKEAANAAPKAMMVKVNPETKTVEVFRVNKLSDSITAKAATSGIESTIATIENPENKVAEFKLSNKELDKDSSTEAWWYRWWGYSYRWNYWGGYSPYYYNWGTPFYNPGYFSYGYGYRYNYAWNYGWNNCYYGWYY